MTQFNALLESVLALTDGMVKSLSSGLDTTQILSVRHMEKLSTARHALGGIYVFRGSGGQGLAIWASFSITYFLVNC